MMSLSERGSILAYGHAAYCAGWKAAMQCVLNPESIEDAHSRKWIEGNPPEAFDAPLVWWDGVAASADTLPKGRDAKQGLAGTESGAVGSEASETPNPQHVDEADARNVSRNISSNNSRKV